MIELTDHTGEVFELISLVFDIFGVLIIVMGVLMATLGYLRGEQIHQQEKYHNYRVNLGRALLLGLEVLVAADIIKTVALEPSFKNLGILAILVAIRTFLSWALVLETEGRLLWQKT